MQDILQGNYSNYETEELVVMYQYSQRDEYLQEVIRRNEGLLHKWARDYNNIPNCDDTDLLEEGYIALWMAVEHFDIERGNTFASCLKGYVKQHYNRLYNEATRKKRFTGIEPCSYDELVEISKEGFVEVDIISNVAVEEFISSLEGKVQYIAVNLLDGKSKGDIARALGITPASTSYHIKRLQNLAVEYFGLRGTHSLSEAL